MTIIMKSVCLMLLASTCNAANILGFLPFYGISHNRVTMPLMEELAKRGHNVTVAGYFEPKNPFPNHKTILFKPLEGAELVGFLSLKDFQDAHYMTTMHLINLLFDDYPALMKKNDYHRIYEGEYDVVVVEFFESDLFPAFASKLNAPFIVFHTSEALPWHRTILNDYNSPAEIPHSFNGYGGQGKMDFYERFWNTVEIGEMLFYYYTVIAPKANSLAKEHLGDVNTEIKAKEASLFFVNTHFSFTGARPTSPSTIEVGGLHVAPRKALSQDIQSLLDNAKNGVIFFSMGSVLKGNTMSDDKRDAFLRVFSELKETVLWKWEGDLPNKPANLHTSPWFPQRDIFAHPNLKLFIGHCGLLGVHEAITEALPIICLPMFGDQPFNAAALKRQGFGLSLEYASFTEELFRETINRVLKEPSFKENAKRVSAAFKDRPMSAMDTAVYWTEYVIRHKGAHHLKSPARYMAWWEYHNVDVLATIGAIVLTVLILLYKMTKSFLTLLFCRRSNTKVKTS